VRKTADSVKEVAEDRILNHPQIYSTDIYPVYPPIFKLDTDGPRVHGYEAFIRTQKGYFTQGPFCNSGPE